MGRTVLAMVFITFMKESDISMLIISICSIFSIYVVLSRYYPLRNTKLQRLETSIIGRIVTFIEIVMFGIGIAMVIRWLVSFF